MRHAGGIFFIILPIFAIYTAMKIRQVFFWKKSSHPWLFSFLSSILLFAIIIGWQISFRLHRSVSAAGSISPSKVHEVSLVSTVATWAVSVPLGLWATWILFSLIYDIGTLIVFLLRRLFRSPPLDPRRRDIFLHWVPTGLLSVSGLTATIGLGQAIVGPTIKEVDLEIENLPHQLKGLRVVQFSDLHVSPLIEKKYVENVVEKILDLKPDVIVMTGDIADGTPTELAAFTEPLKNLKSPLGTFYVTGNHEYYWNVEKWLEAARGFGFQPLINESRILNFNGVDFLLGGVTDTSGGEFLETHESDPVKTMGTHRELPFKLLLAHRPESCFKAADAGWDLQLSGHTHAGQFFPFSLTMPFAHKYYKGLNRHKNLWLYVNAGTGFWGPPQRFAIPSEITLIKLS